MKQIGREIPNVLSIAINYKSMSSGKILSYLKVPNMTPIFKS